MKRSIRLFLPLAALAIGVAADAPPPGYLGGATIDITPVLPPAPKKGDIRYEADRKIFKATRGEKGSARWQLATDDVPSSIADVMTDFSCAAGIALSPAATPATYRLLANASADTGRATNAAKDIYKRLRPLVIDKGPVCEKDRDELAKSYDYPSGHTTRGWTFGLVLSELLPDRASPILVRARSYGESRIVCGAHNMSAVEAGRLSATVTMQSVRAAAGYRSDLETARAELAAAKASGARPDAGMCSAETALTVKSVLVGLKK
jgi:acid phosphatase (class A)